MHEQYVTYRRSIYSQTWMWPIGVPQKGRFSITFLVWLLGKCNIGSIIISEASLRLRYSYFDQFSCFLHCRLRSPINTSKNKNNCSIRNKVLMKLSANLYFPYIKYWASAFSPANVHLKIKDPPNMYKCQGSCYCQSKMCRSCFFFTLNQSVFMYPILLLVYAMMFDRHKGFIKLQKLEYKLK